MPAPEQPDSIRAFADKALSRGVDVDDYAERVYAGILGKIIGVYLGRPFEGWTNERIERELGEINYFVHERLNHPLVVTDDDISGTFTFVRALPENGNRPDLSAAEIGDWWLNTIVPNRSILWWGGVGMSTEHTAYFRLKQGVRAPASGAIEKNGKVVAEQIGAQIFIDGWGMICPGDPERAADFARRAASVSHDGEAIYGAQVVAALEAQAFVENDIQALLDCALGMIPRQSVIYRMSEDVRAWAAANGDDWRATLRQIQQNYGYDRFPGVCHMVPNHALILLGLLHGNDDFQRSLMIVNTAGWDTDCNSGNLGCILGIKNGLAGIDSGPDWRGPIADRLYLPTADGGRCVTDAVCETYEVVNIGRTLAGREPLSPKDGARFHFSLPGSVQSFRNTNLASTQGKVTVGNRDGQLAIGLDRLPAGESARIGTPTFIPPEDLSMPGYALLASPALYSGQTVKARLIASDDLTSPVEAHIYVGVYNENRELTLCFGRGHLLSSGQETVLEYPVPGTNGQPIAMVGIEIRSDNAVSGTVLLDWLTWEGTPVVTFQRPENGGNLWERAWVSSVNHFHGGWVTKGWTYRIIQDEGPGMISQGEWTWSNYTASTRVLPHLCKRTGLAVAVRGLHRYIGLILDSDRRVRLIQQRDSDRQILAEFDTIGELERPLSLSLSLDGARIIATADTETKIVSVGEQVLRGAVALLIDSGHAEFDAVHVQPYFG